MQITPFSCTIPDRQAFQSSPYNSNQQLPQQAISLSLCFSSVQFFMQSNVICRTVSISVKRLLCVWRALVHAGLANAPWLKNLTITESQRQRNYSQARSFSPQGHIHSQTHSLKSSSFTCVNSELKLFSWITEIYNGRFVNEKRMSNVNSQPWLKDR